MDSEFKGIIDLFNARTTIISISTTNILGRIDSAPVGTATLIDEKTLILLKGPINQTYHNLKDNPEAVFMALNYKVSNWFKFFFTGKFGASFGYRIHTKFREEREIDANSRALALKRFGLINKLRGGQIINSTLSKMLVFEVTEVREIKPFG